MANPASKETALWVLRRLRQAGHQALFAGGSVRDMLLGAESYDYDIATSARPDEVAKLFRHVLLVGAQFGVAMVVHRRQTVEVATFRSDLDYADGRRPTGVVYSTPEQDARRRDFTINGMFYDPIAEEVIDYVGGRADLARRVIRTIGPPAERFGEDYLRMIRAVRFAVRLGFTIDQGTAEAICRLAPKVTGISGERIFDELTKMMQISSAGRALRKLDELGLAAHILPEVHADRQRWARAVSRVEAITAGADAHEPARPLGALLCETDARAIRRVVRRWGAPNVLRDVLLHLAGARDDWQKAADWPLHRFKKLMAAGSFDLLTELWAWQERQQTGRAERTEAARARARSIPADRVSPAPLVTGQDLKSLGLSEGPALGRILRALYDRQLDEEFADRSEAMRAAEAMIGPAGEGDGA